MRHLAPRTIDVLRIINRNPSTRNEIAKKVKFQISVLNSILSRLEKSGHIRRGGDANVAYFQQAKFSITDSGKQMMKLGSGTVKDKPLPHSGVFGKALNRNFNIKSDHRNVMSRETYRTGDGENFFFRRVETPK